MRFAYTDDQIELADAVGGLLANECPPEVVRAAWPEGLDKSEGARFEAAAVDRVWSQLAEMGVLSVGVAEEAGGFGMDELALAVILTQVGRYAAPVPVLESAAVVAPLLAEAGDPGGHLAGVLDGSVRPALALVDGAPVAFASTATHVLWRSGDELRLLEVADAAAEALDSVDGARGAARVAPQPGAGTLISADAAVADLAFDRAALGASAMLVGLGRAMLDQAVDYAKERKQFGAAIGTFQAVKHHLADVALGLEFAAPAVARAADSVARGLDTRARDVSMAKAMAGDAAEVAGRKALQVHGGIGYTVEYDLHLFQKRAWALAASFGTGTWHRNRVGTAIGV